MDSTVHIAYMRYNKYNKCYNPNKFENNSIMRICALKETARNEIINDLWNEFNGDCILENKNPLIMYKKWFTKYKQYKQFHNIENNDYTKIWNNMKILINTILINNGGIDNFALDLRYYIESWKVT